MTTPALPAPAAATPTFDHVLGLIQVTAAGLAASGIAGVGAQLAIGTIIALAGSAAKLARGEDPGPLPTYEEGLATYLKVQGVPT